MGSGEILVKVNSPDFNTVFTSQSMFFCTINELCVCIVANIAAENKPPGMWEYIYKDFARYSVYFYKFPSPASVGIDFKSCILKDDAFYSSSRSAMWVHYVPLNWF